jgi:transcriptional regulator of acetoin/glycerol metabolism
MLREWPGNVRELGHEARAAALAARAASSGVVRPEHLGADAGMPFDADKAEVAPRSMRTKPLTRAEIERALEATGAVTSAARALGLHRNQLYRELKRHGIRR